MMFTKIKKFYWHTLGKKSYKWSLCLVSWWSVRLAEVFYLSNIWVNMVNSRWVFDNLLIGVNSRLKRSSSFKVPGIVLSCATWNFPFPFGPLNSSMQLSRFILDIPHESFSRKYFLSFFIFLLDSWVSEKKTWLIHLYITIFAIYKKLTLKKHPFPVLSSTYRNWWK